SITLGVVGNSALGKVSGTGVLIKSGAGALVLNNGADDYSGGTVVEQGVLESEANTANATPFGSGSIDLRGGGRLFVHPANGSSGANITIRALSAPGAQLTYAAGSEIKIDHINGASSWNLAKLDLGSIGAGANSVLNRAPGGTLVLI